MIRELEEETGISLLNNPPKKLGSLKVNHDGVHFNYYTYLIKLSVLPIVQIRTEEHQDFGWFTKSELPVLPLVTDMKECVKKYI